MKSTRPGRTEYLTNPKSLLLYNYDIDSDQLKPEHKAFLLREVVPVLKRGGSVSLVGLASRTGSHSHNLALSKRRAENTLAFLRKSVPDKFNARQVSGFGESKAEQEGYADHSEMERFRSVVVFTYAAPKPPEPPKKIVLTKSKPRFVARPVQFVQIELVPFNTSASTSYVIIVEKFKMVPRQQTFPYDMRTVKSTQDTTSSNPFTGMVVNVSRNTIKWRKPTTSDTVKKYAFGVLDFFRGAAEFGGAELPQKIDPRQNIPGLSKKYAPGKLGYYPSWAAYKKIKNRSFDKYEKF